MKKVVIFGFSGGGKSTLARKMGEILDIEPVHFDAIHWLPGWVESSVEYKKEIIAEVLKRDKWIIDGNYRKVFWKERLDDADTVIFIDVNRFTCFYQAWKRSRIYKGKTRPDMGEGCTEKFDFEFAKWILLDGRKKRKSNLEIMKTLKDMGKDTYILKSRKDIDNFLKGLKKV
ncbi:MAG: DNA topology modulation protein FlaR [Clostridia bacterium]|nr:DNA topology modulation protein FlaR [Clostridia bacterium]